MQLFSKKYGRNATSPNHSVTQNSQRLTVNKLKESSEIMGTLAEKWFQEGVKRGIELGKKEGVEKGIELGKRTGLEKGIEQAKIEDAKKMILKKNGQ